MVFNLHPAHGAKESEDSSGREVPISFRGTVHTIKDRQKGNTIMLGTEDVERDHSERWTTRGSEKYVPSRRGSMSNTDCALALDDSDWVQLGASNPRVPVLFLVEEKQMP
eukprot:scaffold1118_cov135-Cylindrotheca_fusiformis.AAC.5